MRGSHKINTCPFALIWNNSDRPFWFELPVLSAGVSAAVTRQCDFSCCPVLLPSRPCRGCSQDDSPLNPLYANLRDSEAVFRNPCLKPGLGDHIGVSEPLIQREIDLRVRGKHCPCTGDVLHSLPQSVSPIQLLLPVLLFVSCTLAPVTGLPHHQRHLPFHSCYGHGPPLP